MRFAFHQCDVFTDKLFGGNPLAVVLDADALDSATMQAFAREANCSESSFVLRPRNPSAAFRVRIFTPGNELPFAGHPTIGTAWTLHRLGLLSEERFAFEMEVGLVSVRRDGERFWMSPPAPRIGALYEPNASLATALGLPPGMPLASARRVGSFLCVQLLDEAALAIAQPQRSALRMLFDGSIADGDILLIYFDRGHVQVRMFADIGNGIGEDPATGSAVAPMLHYLALNGALACGIESVEITQGDFIRRPSRLHARLRWEASTPTDIEVGGSSVHAFSSEIELEAGVYL